MQRLFILGAFCFILTLSAAAQHNDSYRTILGNPRKVSGFGTILSQVSYSSNNQVRSFYSSGIEGGLLFNQRSYFGLFGMTSLAPENISRVETAANTSRDIRLVQAGILLGRKFSPNSAVHFNFATKVGGGLLLRTERYGNWNYGDTEVAQEGLLLISPSLSVEVNVFSWMQLQAGGGYSYLIGNQVFNLDPQRDLSLPYLQFGVSFGGFR